MARKAAISGVGFRRSIYACAVRPAIAMKAALAIRQVSMIWPVAPKKEGASRQVKSNMRGAGFIKPGGPSDIGLLRGRGVDDVARIHTDLRDRFGADSSYLECVDL